MHCLSGEGKDIIETMESENHNHVNTKDCQELVDDKDDETEDTSEISLCEEEESDEEDDGSFKMWLKDVSECLRGFRKFDPDQMQAAAEDDMEEETEEERCLRIVRSVLDENTVLEMVKTYLRFIKVPLICSKNGLLSNYFCRMKRFLTLPR